MKLINDEFCAYLVEGAKFTPNEEYPIIPDDYVYKDYPNKIINFKSSFNYKGNFKDTFICFYSPDRTFEKIRQNPRKFISHFKKFGGIIGPDFSIHTDMPQIKQKEQINKNLELTYFYGSLGIPIIPNIRIGDDTLLDEYLNAIPKGCPVCFGTHGFNKTIVDKSITYCFISKVIETINPSKILIYGGLSHKMYDSIKQKHSLKVYHPHIYRYREEK